MRPPKLEALKSIDREPLLDFLVIFKRARAKDPSMDVSEWLRGQVIYNIRSHGINVDNTEAVLQHLDNIEKLQAESRIKHSISRLRKKLQWPSEAQNRLEAARIFILRARDILGPDRNLSKGAQKGVIKTLVEILPQYFSVNDRNFLDTFPEVTTISDFARHLKKMTPTEDAMIRSRGIVSIPSYIPVQKQDILQVTQPLVETNNALMNLSMVKPVEKVVISLNVIQTRLEAKRCFLCGDEGHFVTLCDKRKTDSSDSN
eukprot:snap_masked-scaffold_28-processed-gene-3.27-mRNA-1 protein AED:1.00 eAED:1.00 QI:0/-1/0/0/-1/1/1/0/258